MTVSDAIRSRRSIRKYVPGIELTQEQIHTLLEAAMMAPSACNTRPWEFVVVQSEEIRSAIAKVHPFCRHILQASAGIVICARPDLQKGIAEGFFPQDCGAAIENILLQAVELGLGCCWCGVYPRQPLIDAVKDLLQVESVPLAIVTVGVPADTPAARGYYDEDRVSFR